MIRPASLMEEWGQPSGVSPPRSLGPTWCQVNTLWPHSGLSMACWSDAPAVINCRPRSRDICLLPRDSGAGVLHGFTPGVENSFVEVKPLGYSATDQQGPSKSRPQSGKDQIEQLNAGSPLNVTTAASFARHSFPIFKEIAEPWLSDFIRNEP